MATNGQCFSSPNSQDALSTAQHLLSFTFSPAAAALALSSPLWFFVISLSASGLHYLHLPPHPFLSLSYSLSLITTHYLLLGGVTGFLIIDCAAFQRQPRFTSRSYSSISSPPKTKTPKHTHTLPFTLSLSPFLSLHFCPGGLFLFSNCPFASCNFPFITPASLANCARQWDDPSSEKVRDRTRGVVGGDKNVSH